MRLKFTLPVVQGRGAGLGNELIPWCRAFLAAQCIDAISLKPAFGLNRRRYGRHFGTSSADWLWQRGLRAAWPQIEFAEADHLRYGGGDVLHTFSQFAREHGLHERKSVLVTTRGMWGGYAHVAAARPFVQSTLYSSRYAPRNLALLRSRLDATMPVVGMHVRLGDFEGQVPLADYQGRFNTALPMAWYLGIAEQLESLLKGRVQFFIASDGTAEQLRPLTERHRCVLSADIPDSDCSDLLALAQCDLLVCSVSSFSAWAAFMSDAPYLWFRHQLHAHPQGFLSIWGHEPRQSQSDGPTQMSIGAWLNGEALVPRGWPVGMDEAIPAQILQSLLVHHRQRRPAGDLVQYGAMPMNPPTAAFAAATNHVHE